MNLVVIIIGLYVLGIVGGYPKQMMLHLGEFVAGVVLKAVAGEFLLGNIPNHPKMGLVGSPKNEALRAWE